MQSRWPSLNNAQFSCETPFSSEASILRFTHELIPNSVIVMVVVVRAAILLLDDHQVIVRLVYGLVNVLRAERIYLLCDGTEGFEMTFTGLLELLLFPIMAGI